MVPHFPPRQYSSPLSYEDAAPAVCSKVPYTGEPIRGGGERRKGLHKRSMLGPVSVLSPPDTEIETHLREKKTFGDSDRRMQIADSIQVVFDTVQAECGWVVLIQAMQRWPRGDSDAASWSKRSASMVCQRKLASLDVRF
jgi:hypothetical protein